MIFSKQCTYNKVTCFWCSSVKDLDTIVNMSTLTLIFLIVLIVSGALCCMANFSRDLMMLQQNSYRNERYVHWFSQSGESTRLGRVICCIALMLLLIQSVPVFASVSVAVIVALCQTIGLWRKKYKKPLTWTPRARRIFGVSVLLAIIIVALFAIFLSLKAAGCAFIAISVVSPLFVLGANDILRPVEASINKKYYNEAADILQSMPTLKIVGITGSYGKTSTKHYLHRILQEHFATTMTPGSFNTTMGVIRTIRENLRPYDEIFIVEMGAKQPGDIKEICDLVHPDIGVITAVGEQHLESFKSIENVQKTKFELADALSPEGVVVINNDFPYVANRDVKNTNCIRYAVANTEDADYMASDITYTPTGTDFTVSGAKIESPIQLHTRLVGECNVSNLLAAIIVALKLGVPEQKIRYAVAQIEQVEHRLNMKRTPSGITIIDDAFNSNPVGSRMAMEVLAMMTNGQRIVITPGMIELGDRQYQANEEFGRTISRCADVAIVVGQYNRDAILAGIAQGPISPENVHAVDSFNDAQSLLQTIAHSGDTVLYENDLPDTFK